MQGLRAGKMRRQRIVDVEGMGVGAMVHVVYFEGGIECDSRNCIFW